MATEPAEPDLGDVTAEDMARAVFALLVAHVADRLARNAQQRVEAIIATRDATLDDARAVLADAAIILRAWLPPGPFRRELDRRLEWLAVDLLPTLDRANASRGPRLG